MRERGAGERWWASLPLEEMLAVVAGLKKFGRHRAAKVLIGLLDPAVDLHIRIAAAQALGYLGDRRAIVPFGRIAGDRREDLGLRCTCTEALWWFARRRRVQVLLRRLARDEEAWVRGSALCAIGLIVPCFQGIIRPFQSTLRHLQNDDGLLCGGEPIAVMAARVLSRPNPEDWWVEADPSFPPPLS
jgi:hypothetical protein